MSDAADLKKPPFGSPCNGCGLCCREALCPIAVGIFGPITAPCPALVRDGAKQVCGVIAAPSRFVPELVDVHGAKAISSAAALLLGSGIGCDSQGNDEPDVPGFIDRMTASTPDEIRAEEAALNIFDAVLFVGFALS
jgi:hypothetical protein